MAGNVKEGLERAGVEWAGYLLFKTTQELETYSSSGRHCDYVQNKIQPSNPRRSFLQPLPFLEVGS